MTNGTSLVSAGLNCPATVTSQAAGSSSVSQPIVHYSHHGQMMVPPGSVAKMSSGQLPPNGIVYHHQIAPSHIGLQLYQAMPSLVMNPASSTQQVNLVGQIKFSAVNFAYHSVRPVNQLLYEVYKSSIFYSANHQQCHLLRCTLSNFFSNRRQCLAPPTPGYLKKVPNST